jgi:L-alanine-DL-glutamate epimerase-like enolase superfamily enzyme
VDLIANTFIKNRDQINLIKFLRFIKKKKILWIEEALNVDDLNYFSHLDEFKKIPFSYGENFTSFIDLNLFAMGAI